MGTNIFRVTFDTEKRKMPWAPIARKRWNQVAAKQTDRTPGSTHAVHLHFRTSRGIPHTLHGVEHEAVYPYG